LSTYPANINIEQLSEIGEKKENNRTVAALHNISLHVDLTQDYNERVVVYSNGDYGTGIINLLEISTIAPKVLDVYKARRALLPEKYIGVHIRNTDYTSDVDKFLETHDGLFNNNPIFLASDNKKTIDLFKRKYGKNLYVFANIPDNNGAPIHVGYKRTKEESREYNIDTFVDILLLATADTYYFSCAHSGFSKNVYKLRTKPELIKRLVSS
jgi:hypothetical protein